jgi:hypothetical protein
MVVLYLQNYLLGQFVCSTYQIIVFSLWLFIVLHPHRTQSPHPILGPSWQFTSTLDRFIVKDWTLRVYLILVGYQYSCWIWVHFSNCLLTWQVTNHLFNCVVGQSVLSNIPDMHISTYQHCQKEWMNSSLMLCHIVTIT